MKTLAIALFALLSATAFMAVVTAEESPVCESGICVVEFNAAFNSQNSVEWIDKLNDCEVARVDILASPEMQKEHKIVVVPTIIVFNDGEETERFQANIMMAIDATKKDVQSVIDEILMSSF